jgi:hypothetical protein
MEFEGVMDGASIKKNIMHITIDFRRRNSGEGLVGLSTPVVKTVVAGKVQVLQYVFDSVIMNFSRAYTVLGTTYYCI